MQFLAIVVEKQQLNLFLLVGSYSTNWAMKPHVESKANFRGFFFLIEEFDNNLYEINFIWPADENLAKKSVSL